MNKDYYVGIKYGHMLKTISILGSEMKTSPLLRRVLVGLDVVAWIAVLLAIVSAWWIYIAAAFSTNPQLITSKVPVIMGLICLLLCIPGGPWLLGRSIVRGQIKNRPHVVPYCVLGFLTFLILFFLPLVLQTKLGK